MYESLAEAVFLRKFWLSNSGLSIRFLAKKNPLGADVAVADERPKRVGVRFNAQEERLGGRLPERKLVIDDFAVVGDSEPVQVQV